MIKTGVVSYGYSSKIFHLPYLTKHEGYIVKKIFSRNSDESKKVYPDIEVVKSYEELLNDQDIELVIIATPNHLHYSMAKEALIHNKNVVVEKPFTITSDEAQELINLSKDKNLILTVYHNRRWDGDFLTIKKLIQQNKLGKILEFESRFDRYRPELGAKLWKEEGTQGNNLLYDLGIHLIDQAIHLFGIPTAVYADLRIQRDNSKVIDYFDIHLDFEYTKAILKASVFAKEKPPRFIVHGTEGSYIKYGLDPQEGQSLDGVSICDEIFGKDIEEFYGILHTNDIDRTKIQTEKGYYYGFYENLYKAIRYKEPLAVKPEEAMESIKIIEFVLKSYENNCKIVLKN